MKYVSRPVSWHPTAHTHDFIPAIISSPTIRVHKSWRAAFIVLIIITKILLGFCAYFYLRAEMNVPAANTPQPALHAQP